MRKPRKTFWDKEYSSGDHLALSNEPSEDLIKFLRFLEREYNGAYLQKGDSVLDLGCGNGRNLIYLAREYGISGTGYDSSREAIAQAATHSGSLPLLYEVRTIAGDLSLPDSSQTLVLDMMTSHFLPNEKRDFLRKEIARVLKPGGWLFFKTLFLDDDPHTKRLLKEHPADEVGSYIHPEMSLMEHAYSEEEIQRVFSPLFTIHKILPSYGHLRNKAKRRSVSVYLEKN